MPRYCDIVMKGGITSGVVYPAAVVEIAKTFTFKNVGGTSAGAIAAALTAAAERRRARDGSMDGFDRLGAIPGWLAADNHLFRLFVPNAGTRSLFKTIVGLFGRSRIGPAWLSHWLGLVWAFPLAAACGAIVGMVFAAAVVRTFSDTPLWLWVLALVAAVFTIVAGMTLAIGIALVRDLLGRLPKNYYGLVTGIDDADGGSEVALCTWLAAEMERCAGLEGGVPLTFGMLWDAKRDTGASGLDALPAGPDVNLEMITTNVTWGRPYNFPVSTNVFMFDPAEMRRFFPDYVVDWMVARQRPPADDREAAQLKSYAPRIPLPLPGDLPVIVATRMSLAFPVLLSAVPLWAADYQNVPHGGTAALKRCWFSDGGISSNFPITLFDSPLPRWPTFGINLGSFPDGQVPSADESQNVSMPKTNLQARLLPFNGFDSVPGFISTIVNAMQNWTDNTQSVLPGYRDRIVTVLLDPKTEGGLNLDMPPEVLARLRARGAAAGTLLASRFGAPSDLLTTGPVMNWENHRWLRFRSTMGAAKDYLTHYAAAAEHPEAPDVAYSALIGATTGAPAASYQLDPAARDTVAAEAAQLTAVGTQLAATAAIDERLPHPSVRLGLRGSLKS